MFKWIKNLKAKKKQKDIVLQAELNALKQKDSEMDKAIKALQQAIEDVNKRVDLLTPDEAKAAIEALSEGAGEFINEYMYGVQKENK